MLGFVSYMIEKFNKLFLLDNRREQWERLAGHVEADKAVLFAQLHALKNAAARQPAAVASGLRQASRKAAGSIELDEIATRQLIDEQLRQAGWEADSQELRYSKGARPQKNRNRAIAEWPTSSGPADYVLFVGLTPLAAVEAKRARINAIVKGRRAITAATDLRLCRFFGFSKGFWLRMQSQPWPPGEESTIGRILHLTDQNGRIFAMQIALAP